MRPLTLHISALTDAEYELYTSVVNELCDNESGQQQDDAYYEQVRISVREARAWIRGRYACVGAGKIDTILKYFSPGLEAGDTITGGQLFAALRMVVHAETGREIERGLAFIQAFPTLAAKSRATSPLLPSSAGRKPPVPQRRPTITKSDVDPVPTSSNPFSTLVNTSPNDPHANHPHSHPQPPPQHPRRSLEISRHPPPPPSAESKPPPPPPPVPSLKPTASTFTNLDRPDLQHQVHTNNPFVRPDTAAKPGFASSRSEDGGRLPPLPPRKPTKDAGKSISSSSYANPLPQPPKSFPSTPPIPPKPAQLISLSQSQSPSPPIAKPPPHTTSTLMRQSLQASKAAQTMKRAQELLEKERTIKVLKRSSVASGSGTTPPVPPPRNRSQSPAKYSASLSVSSRSSGGRESPLETAPAPPLPRRPRKIPSPPESESSLAQVALAWVSSHPALPSSPSSQHQLQLSPFSQPATIDSRSSSPTRSRPSSSLDLPRPPAHPDRKPVLGLNTAGERRDGEWEKVYGANGGAVSSPATTTAFSYANLPSGDIRTPTGEETPTKWNDSPTARVFRSKSMHSPGSVGNSPGKDSRGIPPPPRRKRPESIQALPGLGRHVTISGATGHYRRSSLSTDHASTSGTNPFGENPFVLGVQKTLTTTLEGLQPKLDKARYKAEAGLSRRGYVARGKGEEGEGLMRHDREEQDWDAWDRVGGMHGSADVYDEPDVDADEEWVRAEREAEEDGGTLRAKGKGRRDDFWIKDRERESVGEEKDNLKLPAGEGWKLL